jgi:hypothetical protein
MTRSLISETEEKEEAQPVETRFTKLRLNDRRQSSGGDDGNELVDNLSEQIEKFRSRQLYNRSSSDAFVGRSSGFMGSFTTTSGSKNSEKSSPQFKAVNSPTIPRKVEQTETNQREDPASAENHTIEHE